MGWVAEGAEGRRGIVWTLSEEVVRSVKVWEGREEIVEVEEEEGVKGEFSDSESEDEIEDIGELRLKVKSLKKELDTLNKYVESIKQAEELNSINVH